MSKKMEWKWLAPEGDGQGAEGRPRLEVAGKIFTLGKAKAQEVDEYEENLKDAKEVFQVLVKAKAAFSSGAADYAGACDRLKVLTYEYRKAEAQLGRAVGDIGAFFEPTGLANILADDYDALKAVIGETIERLLMEQEGQSNG